MSQLALPLSHRVITRLSNKEMYTVYPRGRTETTSVLCIQELCFNRNKINEIGQRCELNIEFLFPKLAASGNRDTYSRGPTVSALQNTTSSYSFFRIFAILIFGYGKNNFVTYRSVRDREKVFIIQFD